MDCWKIPFKILFIFAKELADYIKVNEYNYWKRRKQTGLFSINYLFMRRALIYVLYVNIFISNMKIYFTFDYIKSYLKILVVNPKMNGYLLQSIHIKPSHLLIYIDILFFKQCIAIRNIAEILPWQEIATI